MDQISCDGRLPPACSRAWQPRVPADSHSLLSSSVQGRGSRRACRYGPPLHGEFAEEAGAAGVWAGDRLQQTQLARSSHVLHSRAVQPDRAPVERSAWRSLAPEQPADSVQAERHVYRHQRRIRRKQSMGLLTVLALAPAGRLLVPASFALLNPESIAGNVMI